MNKEQYPEIFSDELAGLMFGYPISKLTFVAVKQVGADGSAEKAKVLTLSIPTQSLLNACNLIMDNARKNQEIILGAASASEANLLASLQSGTDIALTKKTTVASKKTKAVSRIKGK